MDNQAIAGHGIHLYSSNRVEALAQRLCRELIRSPLRSPFQSEIIVVPGPAMARWLNLQIAALSGVASNIDYPLMASWIWESTSRCLGIEPDADPLDRDSMRWKLFELLAAHLEDPRCAEIHHYLQSDDDGIKRWQLAGRISDVFDRYQFYRPDLIREWTQCEADDWQALLWQNLIRDIQYPHRVRRIDRSIRRLQGDSPACALPARVSVFALSTIPPLFVEFLCAIAQHTTIHLYQHSPTDQYWADLKNKKQLARMRLAAPGESIYFDGGNPLLASWGRQGQALQDLLLDSQESMISEWDAYQPPQQDSLLGRVQRSIFDLAPATGVTTDPADDSIRLHICHSPLRECQVLHDRLLAMMQSDPSLKPEEILVMIPAINDYAPYIEAVFQHDPDERRPFIPWNLSDTGIADEHPLIQAFLELLRLPTSRFAASEVLAWLDVNELTSRFNLSVNDCANVRSLLEDARVRWGLDADHKEALQLPGCTENTWQQARDRLFAGYAFGDTDLWEGIAPIAESGGSRADSLGRFWTFFGRLQNWRDRLQEPRSASSWQSLLNNLLEDFFHDPTDDDGRLQQIRDAIDHLQTGGGEQVLSPALLRYSLEEQLNTVSAGGRYFSGGVSFCGMKPMRTLPFRVICVLGLNERDFPRRDHPIEFDRMAAGWRPGDPLKSDEDRYLFLETLLCARERLYLSYCGRDLHDNSELQPSVIVRELLDYLNQTDPDAAAETSAERQIRREHGMQPFSRANFDGDERSFNPDWCAIARAIAHPPASAAHADWPRDTLDAAHVQHDALDAERLRLFLQHPVKAFFTTRLRIRLDALQESCDDEPFNLNGLQRWELNSALISEVLKGETLDLKTHAARGELRHGPLPEIDLQEATDAITPLLEMIDPFVQAARQTLSISLQPGNQRRLDACIHPYYPARGVLHYHASKLNGKRLLSAWLDHLLVCAAEQLQPQEYTLLACTDQCRKFAPLDAARALRYLNEYSQWYVLGMQRPLPVFPGASFAWASAGKPEARLAATRKAWDGSGFADARDPYIQLAFRGVAGDPLESDEFAELATAWYREALERAEHI